MGKPCPNPACGAFMTDDGAVFCSRCAAPLPSSSAGTQVNPALAPPPWQAAPPPARGGSAAVIVAVAVATLAVGAGVFAVVARRSPSASVAPPPVTSITANREEQRVPLPSPTAVPTPTDPMATPTSVPPIRAWLSSVHYRSPAGVELHPGDLDAADGRCARLTGAMITLEAPRGEQFVSDGDPQRADLELRFGAPVGGAYDVELGVGHNRFVPVRRDLVGDQALDLDRLGQRVGRFVRITTRRTGGSVCLDGVSVVGSVPHAPAGSP